MPELFIDALRESRRRNQDVKEASEVAKRTARELFASAYLHPGFGEAMERARIQDLDGLRDIVKAAKEGIFTRTEMQFTGTERMVADSIGLAVGKGVVSLFEATHSETAEIVLQ